MLTQLQHRVIEMMARRDPIEAIFEDICADAERATAGVLCSIVAVDQGGRLRPLAGPSLPDHYSAALDGIAIGPEVGSCGSAAFLRESVIVTDIFNDRRWAPYRSLAEPLGVRACWSSPIVRGDGRVKGAFGLYFRDARGPTPDEAGLVAACVDLCSIMLDREEMLSDIERLLHRDVLTGLGNRSGYEKRFAEAFVNARPVGLLLIDIDGLREFNATLGSAGGDLIIRTIGQRLARQVQPSRIYRVSGGEFAVLIDGQGEPDVIRKIATRIGAMMREPIRCGRDVLTATVTCGGAVSSPFDLRDPAKLQRDADWALRRAKETARGQFVLSEDTLSGPTVKRFGALRTIARALAEDGIEAHYQPIVNVKTRDVVSFEALCRVRPPTGPLISAGQLGSALQDPSTASLVTDRMLALVPRDIRYWLDRGIAPQRVGINVTMQDFARGDLHERIKAAFSRFAVPLTHLTLEVTESVCLDEDDQDTIRTIESLRREGVLIALDDFGTGYASLTHLLTFPVDVIKVDRSLVSRLSDGHGSTVIFEALSSMAQGLQMRVVGEGVETDLQARMLQDFGCAFAQGYLFGRPAGRDDATRLLERRVPGFA